MLVSQVISTMSNVGDSNYLYCSEFALNIIRLFDLNNYFNSKNNSNINHYVQFCNQIDGFVTS